MSDNYDRSNRTGAVQSPPSMGRRRLLKASVATATLASSGFSGLSAARQMDEDWDDLTLREQLEVVRKATNPYKRLDEMADAGYASAPLPLLCSLGFHFDNLACWNEVEEPPRPPESLLDPRHPESLFYVVNDGGKLKLGGAEFIVVSDQDEDGNPVHPKPEIFNDEDESLDGEPLRGTSEADGWHFLVDPASGLAVWTLHAWVHERNPDGVFATANPRYADMPGCVEL